MRIPLLAAALACCLSITAGDSIACVFCEPAIECEKPGPYQQLCLKEAFEITLFCFKAKKGNGLERTPSDDPHDTRYALDASFNRVTCEGSAGLRQRCLAETFPLTRSTLLAAEQAEARVFSFTGSFFR